MSVFWFILFAVVLGYVLTDPKLGNWIQASGGNAMAATARGVRVARTKVVALRPHRRPGSMGRHHELHPRLGREPQQR